MELGISVDVCFLFKKEFAIGIVVSEITSYIPTYKFTMLLFNYKFYLFIKFVLFINHIST